MRWLGIVMMRRCTIGDEMSTHTRARSQPCDATLGYASLGERLPSVDGLQRNSHESALRSDASMYAAVDLVHTIPGCMQLRRATYFFAFQSRFTSKLVMGFGSS